MKCPESIGELEELERNLPLCKVTLYEQAKARMEKDPEKSERQVAKEIAEEIDRDPEVIRKTIYRAKVGTLFPPDLDGTEKKETGSNATTRFRGQIDQC